LRASQIQAQYLNMKLLFVILLAAGMTGCHRENGYKIVSFSEDPSVSSGSDPILGHKFILLHNGGRIVAHCWVPEHANSGTSCLTLKSKVGETVQLETLKVNLGFTADCTQRARRLCP
jgi:hypothetical protein